jgi:Zn finger protein HypA/HybF involved in hydrogenase expression
VRSYLAENIETEDAEFRCMDCKHEYQDIPGPTECPKCGSIWVKWVNWDEWAEKHGHGTPEYTR